MLVGVVLETLSLGLVVPAIALLMQSDLATTYPRLRPVLALFNALTQTQIVIAGMLALVGIYVVKTLYLGFLAWREVRFAFGVQARLSQQLFDTYLQQPYVFHLSRNSAQLVNNAVGE